MPARLGEGARAGPAPPRGVNPSWPEEEAPVLLTGVWGGGRDPWGEWNQQRPWAPAQTPSPRGTSPRPWRPAGGPGRTHCVLKGARSPRLARKLRGRRRCFGPRG